MLFSRLTVGVLITRQRQLGLLSGRLKILRAMHLFYGCRVGIHRAQKAQKVGRLGGAWRMA